MENVLGKINMKEEAFLNTVEKSDPFCEDNLSPKEFILTEITNNTDVKKVKR